MRQYVVGFSAVLLLVPGLLAAVEDRVVDRVDASRRVAIPGNRHPQAVAANEIGAADPGMELRDVAVLLRPDASIESFLEEQQDPTSANYHKWLTPEQFADRFGLSPADIDKVAQWLRSEGLRVGEVARGRQWITFSGSAANVGRALGTRFRRYRVKGEEHVANADEPSVPAALAAVVGGFDGLHDFAPKAQHVLAPAAEYNGGGGSHAIAPDDFATIYNVKPLYDAGMDASGIGIAVVGQTAIDVADIQAFRRRFNLPPNDPKVVLTGTDPGKLPDEMFEADLDIEWAGAVARNATITYIYSRNVFTAMRYAIDQNIAPVVTVSYGACEIGISTSMRNAVQQANAQGVTVVVASGDQGAAVCDAFFAYTPEAAKGITMSFPANLPEVTAVGGTQFDDGTGNYWNGSNDGNRASALSYIPEAVWNESASRNDIVAGTGGASVYYAKPSWQTGSGTPDDHARDVPDVSLNAGSHVPYLIVNGGMQLGVGGTSAGAPAFAGVVALLNDYLMKQKTIAAAGLGNINPVLYRLAQTTPEAFHDVVKGDNKVWCVQGSPSCVDGKLGHSAGPGYDLATGLGTVDANNLVTKWNNAEASSMTLAVSPGKGDPSTPVTVTAVVTGSARSQPTGAVAFVANGTGFGTAPLVSTPDGMAATIKTTLGLLAGSGKVSATYYGDLLYAPTTASATVELNMPSSGSLVVPFISPNPVPQIGSTWPYTITLYEKAGAATRLTGFTVDGQNNNGNIFTFLTSSGSASNGNLAAGGSISASLAASGLTAPVDRTFVFTGADADGRVWTQQVTVTFGPALGPTIAPGLGLAATPSTVQQNRSADPSCQWAQDLTLDEHGGYLVQLTKFIAGGTDVTGQIQPLFGTTRLAPYGTLRTTLCADNTTIAPIARTYTITGTAENGATVTATARATLDLAPASTAALSIGPQSLQLAVADNQHDATAAIDVSFAGAAPQWRASVTPANATTKWLKVTPIAGTGNGQIAVRASTSGLSNGVYQAAIAFEAPGAAPDHISIPVTLVVGQGDAKIAAVANAASFAQAFAPGMLMSVFVEGLSGGNSQATRQPLPLALGGITATVNGVAAPIVGVYPGAGQINLQVPYEAGGGPAVLAIRNNGKVSSYAFPLAVSAPGLFGVWDAAGRPAASAQQGETLVAYITGEGEVTPFLPTGATPVSGTPLTRLPKARQLLSVTVGGVAADVKFSGISTGLIGVTQINFTIPASVAPGPQPVVVTVGSAQSQVVTLNVTAQ